MANELPPNLTHDFFFRDLRESKWNLRGIGVWQGVAMDSLKFHLGPRCPAFLRPAGGARLKRPFGRFRGGHLQSRRLASVFYPFGHPTPYGNVMGPRVKARPEPRMEKAASSIGRLEWSSWAEDRDPVVMYDVQSSIFLGRCRPRARQADFPSETRDHLRIR
jgi:hypothetical protein